MQFDDDTLMAYADGELPAAEAERIAAAIKADPLLAARVERFRSVRRALKAAYDSVAEEPIPDRLRALLYDVEAKSPDPKPAAPVIDISAAREKRRGFSAQTFAALAACLVGGVLLGRISDTPEEGVLVSGRDGLRAGTELTRVLDQRLASAEENANAAIRVGLSFRSQDGQYCRTFDGAVAGLACRGEDAWFVHVAAPGQSSDYRQAGAETPVMDAVDALIEGEPLDAAQEEEARGNRWRAN